MQPEARRSDTGMPKPFYDIGTEAWTPLLRSGPSGVISVLTLIVWWGHALHARSRWQVDSGPVWSIVVNDLMKTLECLKTASQIVKKRKPVTNGKENGNKRYVLPSSQ